MTDLLLVVGARPNFMKAAPIVRAARGAGVTLSLVHTGQHYERELSDVLFDELGLPDVDVHLGVGSDSQTAQTARIMLAFEPELRRIDPAVVVVVGAFDVVAGRRRRAPAWAQRAGLEWAFRLAQEPVRLGRRYFVGNVHFTALVLGELARTRIGWTRRAGAR